jgi:aspartate/glutamate racemase
MPETRTEILRIAEGMKTDDGVEAIVLAGTELPLLRDSTNPGLAILGYDRYSRGSHRRRAAAE